MSEIFENNPAPVNNIDNNTSTPESNIENQNDIQIEPTLLAILQIEEKYEYIDKIRELKQYIDKLIKRINIVKQGKNNNTEETTISSGGGGGGGAVCVEALPETDAAISGWKVLSRG